MLRHNIDTTIATIFAIDVKTIREPSRGRAKVALARQVSMYLAHVGCRLPLTEVGRIFDRDRTTVRHACAVIEDRRDEPDFDRLLYLLEQIVTRQSANMGWCPGLVERD
ncbi:MAG: helix-turn-helix domain-containing protein [Hyphomicrobiaceae bacterium]